MADVLVMYKKSDMIPMVVTEKHIEAVSYTHLTLPTKLEV